MSEINQEKKTQFLPVIILMILAPTIAELLSGSSPTYLFFQPYYFIFLCGLYGCGALIVRELIVRWQKGWLSALILGIAYAIIEEGIAMKSFFNPTWWNIGELGIMGGLMVLIRSKYPI